MQKVTAADLEDEYKRGLAHGRADMKEQERQCRHLQRQLDEARRELAQYKLEAARRRRND
jgi:hypothetical protein